MLYWENGESNTKKTWKTKCKVWFGDYIGVILDIESVCLRGLNWLPDLLLSKSMLFEIIQVWGLAFCFDVHLFKAAE